MTEEQKAYYRSKICNICNNQNNCDKDKFILNNVIDKSSIKCLDYVYKKLI